MTVYRNYPRAAFFALTAFGGWTVSDAILKLVRSEGAPQGEILLISGMSGMAVIFLVCAMRGTIRRLQPQRWTGLLILGLCQVCSFLCWMVALPYLPLANMYVVAFLTPLTVASMAALFLNEHLGWKRALAIGTGFVGVIIAVNPLNLIHNNGAWLPYLAVFGSMISTATQMFLLRAVVGKEQTECTSFYPRVMLVMAGMAICATTGFMVLKPWVFIALCASGALGGIGWALLAKAYRDAPVAAVAPFHYSQMINGAFLGYLIWGDLPNAYLLCGAMIIIASGIYLVRHERRVSRMTVRVE